MAKRMMMQPRPRQRAELGLAPPREPIPGAITYEQIPWYTGGSWWVSPLNRAGRVAVVMACVRIIAHQISALRGVVTRGGVPVPDQPSWLRNPAPGVYDYWGDAIEAALVSLLIRGNAYLMATAWGSDDYPSSWVVANPDTVAIEEVSGRLVYRWGDNLYAQEEVAHIRWLTAPGTPYGVSPLEGAFANLLSQEALASYASNLAITGAMPFGVLTTEQRLTAKQATDLRTQFHSTGAERQGTLVLDSGLTYQQLQLSPKDMALLELQDYNARALCSVYGVPPSLVSVPSSDGLTYSTVEGNQKALLSFCLDPILAKVEGVISYRFLPGQRELNFSRDRFTLPSFQERMTGLATAVSAGIFTADEARALEARWGTVMTEGASNAQLDP